MLQRNQVKPKTSVSRQLLRIHQFSQIRIETSEACQNAGVEVTG